MSGFLPSECSRRIVHSPDFLMNVKHDTISNGGENIPKENRTLEMVYLLPLSPFTTMPPPLGFKLLNYSEFKKCNYLSHITSTFSLGY